jgi:cytochrome c
MESFEVNKLLGAFLGTVFVVMSVALISDAIYYAPHPEKEGFAIEAAEEPAAGENVAEQEQKPIGPLIAAADPKAGEAVFKKCQACHTAEKGGPNKTGPDLWGIVNRPIASHEGFAYSAGMKEFSQGGSQMWDYDHLNGFLTNPKGYVKGTAMTFAGLKKAEDRAAVIAYLRTMSDSPAPLPQ